MAFNASTLAIVVALMLLAGKANHNDKHPGVAAFLWMSAITVLVWFILVDFVGQP